MKGTFSTERVLWAAKIAVVVIVILKIFPVVAGAFIALKSGVDFGEMDVLPAISVEAVMLTLAQYIATTLALCLFWYSK
ncbi:MAG: hypothetical protein Q4E84_01185 [Clostridia bacterium]|nr:hypothetical protein [Clostridia bacterium]MDO5302499.1 hypothetical protein [Clostridia bacterium]